MFGSGGAVRSNSSLRPGSQERNGIRQLPIGVNLRGLGLRGQDLSRLVRRSPEGEGGRDSVKVAQHPPRRTGKWRAKIRPSRHDGNARLLVSDAAQLLPAFRRSSHPRAGRISFIQQLTFDARLIS
jgi:hypothetical protein